jgi:hypothetical protein
MECLIIVGNVRLKDGPAVKKKSDSILTRLKGMSFRDKEGKIEGRRLDNIFSLEGMGTLDGSDGHEVIKLLGELKPILHDDSCVYYERVRWELNVYLSDHAVH